MPINLIQESVAFPPCEHGSTTWVIGALPDGEGYETTLEYLLDLPTQIVVGESASISGDYLAFQQAQQGGKNAARDYALRHGENTGDTQRTETRRRLQFEAVRRRCTEVPLTGRYRQSA